MTQDYWEYFLSLEADLEKCARYVDFSESNYETHSIEFAKIIMASCAEIDTIAKELSKIISPQTQVANIVQYAGLILVKYPKIIDAKISLPRYELEFQPWKGWSSTDSPDWWRSYNKIKHERTSEFKQASLKNAINSVAGLLLFILYYNKEKNSGKEELISAFYQPRILDVVDLNPIVGMQEGGIFWGYKLP